MYLLPCFQKELQYLQEYERNMLEHYANAKHADVPFIFLFNFNNTNQSL